MAQNSVASGYADQLTLWGIAVVVAGILVRILVHPLRGAIRHGIYQIPPGFLAALLDFVVAGSLVEMDAFYNAVRMSMSSFAKLPFYKRLYNLPTTITNQHREISRPLYYFRKSIHKEGRSLCLQ